jgi:fluoroquinolone transport system permease protein
VANYSQLIKSDFRNIGRDPMLMMASIAPVLLILFALFVFPLVSGLTEKHLNFPLAQYFTFGYIFLIIIAPMLLGMVYGFILLDERDGGIIGYISITPLGKSGYLMVRMLVPSIFSFLFCIMFFLLTGFNDILNLLQLGILALIIATEAPMMLLFLGAFAGNKVEGIAISKGFGILLMTVVLDYFFSGNWRILLSISPLWWIERGVMNPQYIYPYLFGGAIVHFIFIFLLFRKFIRRVG